MKHLFLVALIIGFGILTRAQTEYEVSGNGSQKILKGVISRDLLAGDTCFSWWQPNQAGYTPDAGVVAALQGNSDQIQFLVFGGTWSAETRSILPKFFSILDAASFPAARVTLIGVDQNEKATGRLAEDRHITAVPTFILLKEGKEIGRVTGRLANDKWDEEIGKLAASAR